MPTPCQLTHPSSLAGNCKRECPQPSLLEPRQFPHLRVPHMKKRHRFLNRGQTLPILPSISGAEPSLALLHRYSPAAMCSVRTLLCQLVSLANFDGANSDEPEWTEVGVPEQVLGTLNADSVDHLCAWPQSRTRLCHYSSKGYFFDQHLLISKVALGHSALRIND